MIAKPLQQLEQNLGVKFKDISLLEKATVHRSYLNEHRDYDRGHNERLEFLGDAVLELVVTDHLYRTYSQPEGELTSWRSALVRGDMLAKLAVPLGIGAALKMSHGEEKSGGRERHVLLANAFEAVIGAMYLDAGYVPTRDFIHRTVIKELPPIIADQSHRDAKSRLQEEVQEAVNATPHYVVEAAEGPDHAKRFTVAVFAGDQELSRGQGSSKQTAEQAAATAALQSGSIHKLKRP